MFSSESVFALWSPYEYQHRGPRIWRSPRHTDCHCSHPSCRSIEFGPDLGSKSKASPRPPVTSRLAILGISHPSSCSSTKSTHSCPAICTRCRPLQFCPLASGRAVWCRPLWLCSPTSALCSNSATPYSRKASTGVCPPSTPIDPSDQFARIQRRSMVRAYPRTRRRRLDNICFSKRDGGRTRDGDHSTTDAIHAARGECKWWRYEHGCGRI